MPTDLFVSTAWLAEHLDDANIRIVDIRGHVLPASHPLPHYFNHYDDYLQSHIPQAVFVDWVREITDPADPRHAQIAPPDRYAAVMSRIGIGSETHVIAYDDADGMFAARLWWSLNYYGHERVSVLDGGWNRWIAEGRPTTAVVPTIAPAAFTPRPRPDLIRTGDQVLAHLGANQTLIDVRSPDEFAGRASRARRGGHIPTAHSLPRTTLIGSDGLVPAPQDLRERFAAVGVTEDADDVVFYCNGGVSASYGLLVYRAAGFNGGAVYDGSWKDWGNDDSKPIDG